MLVLHGFWVQLRRDAAQWAEDSDLLVMKSESRRCAPRGHTVSGAR